MAFKKGQSGNPGGRPKKRADLTARCVKAVDDVVVDKWIAEVTEHGEDWLEASKLQAAYGYGKPTERIEAEVDFHDDHGLTHEELREVARLGIQQRLAAQQQADDDDEPTAPH